MYRSRLLNLFTNADTYTYTNIPVLYCPYDNKSDPLFIMLLSERMKESEREREKGGEYEPENSFVY